MSYEYYCMYCGAKLDNKRVLFDMQHLVKGEVSDTKKFSILKIRLTEEELRALVGKSPATNQQYYECELSFAQLLKYMANKNNLNEPRIKKLTLEQARTFIDYKSGFGEMAEQESPDLNNSFFDAFGDEEEVKKADEPEEIKDDYIIPEAISAIIEKDTANTDRYISERKVADDLALLCSGFVFDDKLSFSLSFIHENDNEGKQVLTGYSYKLNNGSIITVYRARVCPVCGDVIFDHAGTAKHQTIAFIGIQKSGKTCVILALANYALNYMPIGDIGLDDSASKIWRGSETIKSVAAIELLSPSERLSEELKAYNNGEFPKKTDMQERNDAYSATFRIKNRASNMYFLLSLVDLAGDLFREDGKIDDYRMRNIFPIALNCDAYIACFDTQREAEQEGDINNTITQSISNICKWTDAVQKLRSEQNNVKTYVPTMLMFTKSLELEQGDLSQLPGKKALPFENIYCLNEEKRRILAVKFYDTVCNQFSEFGRLDKAYHSMIRCSPYGYNVKAKEKNPQLIPKPKNIDKLMRWLLNVTGCIPIEGEFKTMGASHGYLLNNYCIKRPQLRDNNPSDLDEAVARCVIFENPGKFDKSYTGAYSSKAVKLATEFKMRINPNSNSE